MTRGREPVILQSPGNPLVSFRFLFHVGSSADPRGKEGLAASTALMLSRGGTRDRTLTEVTEALYPMAAELSAEPDKDVTTFIGRTHRDHLEEYYALFRDQISKPRFDPQDFERNQKTLSSYLTKSLPSADDEELGKETLERLLYSGHPYGHPVQGTVAGIESITLDDVKTFYRAHYTFDNLRIGLAGDLPGGFAGRVVDDFRGSLPSGAARATDAPLPPVAREKGLRVTIVDKPGAESTAISMGFPLDITRADDDFYPLLVANIYLGDHRTFHGVLMNELRAKRGLNYGDYSYIESFLQDGGSTFPRPNIPRRRQHFSIWVRPVAPESSHFALRAAIYYARKLVEHGMSPEELEEMREYVGSYSKLWVQSLDRRLGYELDSRFYGTDFYLDEIDRRLRGLTLEDVNRAVVRNLDRWDFRVAIVAGNARALATSIQENRESPIVYPTAGTPPDVLREDEAIRVLTLPLVDVSILPVGDVLQK